MGVGGAAGSRGDRRQVVSDRTHLITEGRCVVEDLRAEHILKGFRDGEMSMWSWAAEVVQALVDEVEGSER